MLLNLGLMKIRLGSGSHPKGKNEMLKRINLAL
jgi:hypothetical protein